LAMAGLTYPRDGRAATAIDDVRTSRREGLAVTDSSRSCC
jgi:hypothetical protein